MAKPKADFHEILRVLSVHGVEFVLVGGVAAVLQGAPITTFDLDLVHARNPQNVDRILAALRDLDAIFRDPAGRILEPGASHLSARGHNLLMTRAGPLDLLGAIGAGEGYEELLAHTDELDLGVALRVRVLDLPTLIRTKEAAGRDRDRAVLAILRQTLAQRSGT